MDHSGLERMWSIYQECTVILLLDTKTFFFCFKICLQLSRVSVC